MFSIDRQGLVRSWTRSAARLFGYSAEDVIGRTSTTLFPDDGTATHAGHISRVLAGEPIERLPLHVRRSDGVLTPVALTLVPLAGATVPASSHEI